MTACSIISGSASSRIRRPWLSAKIGFDFFHDYGTEEQQRNLLVKQLGLADSLGLPVIIHSRDAEELTLEVLREHSPARGGIIHCFSLFPRDGA